MPVRRPLARFAHRLLLGGCAGLLGAVAGAQTGTGGPGGGSIYSCVDASGRNITSDRPIASCLDREQRELNPSGSLRRRVEPSYTAKEREAIEARRREAAQAEQRALDERRRDQALLARYPNAGAFERARDEALADIDAQLQGARKRLGELASERRKLDGEMEFYAKEPDKAPVALRRQIESNQLATGVQQRFIGEQEDERRRTGTRFDEARARLQPLWSPAGGGSR